MGDTAGDILVGVAPGVTCILDGDPTGVLPAVDVFRCAVGDEIGDAIGVAVAGGVTLGGPRRY